MSSTVSASSKACKVSLISSLQLVTLPMLEQGKKSGLNNTFSTICVTHLKTCTVQPQMMDMKCSHISWVVKFCKSYMLGSNWILHFKKASCHENDCSSKFVKFSCFGSLRYYSNELSKYNIGYYAFMWEQKFNHYSFLNGHINNKRQINILLFFILTPSLGCLHKSLLQTFSFI